MSIDTVLRSMAYSEAGSLGEAQLLIAKHRNEFDAALRDANAAQMPDKSEGAAVERALVSIETASALSGHAVDKTA